MNGSEARIIHDLFTAIDPNIAAFIFIYGLGELIKSRLFASRRREERVIEPMTVCKLHTESRIDYKCRLADGLSEKDRIQRIEKKCEEILSEIRRFE